MLCHARVEGGGGVQVTLNSYVNGLLIVEQLKNHKVDSTGSKLATHPAAYSGSNNFSKKGGGGLWPTNETE